MLCRKARPRRAAHILTNETLRWIHRGGGGDGAGRPPEIILEKVTHCHLFLQPFYKENTKLQQNLQVIM